MKCAVYRDPGQIAIEEMPIGAVGSSGVKVRVKYCGICGSDVHSYATGQWVGPGLVMGHELSGQVAEIGSDVSGIAVGDRVVVRPLINCGHCWYCQRGAPYFCPTAIGPAYTAPGGFAEYLSLPQAPIDEVLYKIPDHVTYQEAALVEPLSVALHAYNLAKPQYGQNVLVFGSGTIGLTCAQLFKNLGHCHVFVVDLSPLRLQIARDVGIEYALNASDDLYERVWDIVGPSRGAGFVPGLNIDVVVEAAGSNAATKQGLEWVRHGGTFVSIALFEREASVDLNLVVQKELRWLGSFGYNTEFKDAINLIAEERIDVASLVSVVYDLGDIEEAFAVQSNPAQSMKVLVRP